MNTVLRDYQLRGKQLLRQSIGAGNRCVIAQAATGSGKTKIGASIIIDALAKGKRVCFVVPYLTLIDQTIKSFEAEGLELMTDMAVIQADHPYSNYCAPVQICSKDTLARRLAFPIADLVIVDEAHISSKFLDRWKIMRPETTFIGLTATPWAKGMAKTWDDLAVIATTRDLIDRGYLSDFRVYAPSKPDLAGVKARMDPKTGQIDYNQKQLAERTNEPKLVASIVDTWLSMGRGRPTICYAVNCAHAQMIQEQFLLAGVRCGYVDAHTKPEQRAELFQRFADGLVEVICNVGVLVAGFDSDVRCIILATPTKSEIKFVQCVGRGLRTAEGKDYCLILDHSDTHQRLGFVSDIHHHELCDGTPKKASKTEKEEPLPKPCPSCACLLVKGKCPACGFQAKKQSDVVSQKGELVEMTRKSRFEKEETWAMLMHHAKRMGYAKGWVFHTCREMCGSYPREQSHIVPIEPDQKVWDYIRHKQIKNSKRRTSPSRQVAM